MKMITITLKDEDIKGALKTMVINIDPNKMPTESQVFGEVDIEAQRLLEDWWKLRHMTEEQIYGEE